MGEDVEDFVVKTKSKMQDLIKSLTSVASNEYKGFNILNENGQFKNTFEILQGIADIYKEIQEQDERLGNNAATTLVETLAGKNRASVASAILADPDLLRNVYETSQNSDGSAQEELEKYIDSISGRVNQLKNAGEEFWDTFYDEESMKKAIMSLTGFIEKVTTLVDKFGSLPTTLGLVLTALSKGGGGDKYNNVVPCC